LVLVGVEEWKQLLENEDLKKTFSDGCFDMKIVLVVRIRPLIINEENSFTGMIKTKIVEEK